MSTHNPIIAADDSRKLRERSIEEERDQRDSDIETRAELIEDESYPRRIDAATDNDTTTTYATPTPPAATPSVAEAEHDAPYLPGQTSQQANERWQRVQAEFVDDPRKSVSEAHELVSELVQRIVDSFTHERDNLEGTWSRGDSVSTEDLRVCLQRYRMFFSRLLPSADGLGTQR
jgi:molecular chaperone GrpE (heat shock protein)